MPDIGYGVDYSVVRLALTGLVTALGVHSVATDAHWPDAVLRANRVLIPAYIAIDLKYNKITPDVAIHHALVMSSVACCLRPCSGEEYGKIAKMMSLASVNEGMAVLSCLDVLTSRRHRTLFGALHMLNLIFVRRPIWIKLRDESSEDLKTERSRRVIKTLANATMCLDVYWMLTILKGMLQVK
jgi:hypothetical protein